MGKVWGADAVSRNTFTTALSIATALAESPVKEGLLYVGTDDGLIQVSEDGGETWRKIETFPGVPEGTTWVSDLFASSHDPDTVYAAFNNWQRGDYKPYLLRSRDRGEPGNRSPAISRTDTASGASSKTTSTGIYCSPAPSSGSSSPSIGGKNWLRVPGAADDPVPRPGSAEARRRPRAAEPSVAASLYSTTLARYGD